VNPPDWLIFPVLFLRYSGACLVFDMTDLSTALFEAKFGQRGFLYNVVGFINRTAIRVPDLVITSSEVYRRIAIRLGKRTPDSTVTVHSYLERRSSAQTTREAGPLRIGYFGVLGSHDGVDLLIHALAQMQSKQFPEFECVVVGDGPALPSLLDLCRTLKVDERMRFLGFLDGAARDAAVGSFDIAVITDPVNRYTRALCMNKSFVYAAHGLPIVSTPLAGTKRLLGPAALYAESDTPEALADAIGVLLLDSDKREVLAGAVRRRAKVNFDWTTEALKSVTAVDALVATRGRGKVCRTNASFR